MRRIALLPLLLLLACGEESPIEVEDEQPDAPVDVVVGDKAFANDLFRLTYPGAWSERTVANALYLSSPGNEHTLDIESFSWDGGFSFDATIAEFDAQYGPHEGGITTAGLGGLSTAGYIWTRREAGKFVRRTLWAIGASWEGRGGAVSYECTFTEWDMDADSNDEAFTSVLGILGSIEWIDPPMVAELEHRRARQAN
jgi:hypothetical protein